MKYTYMILGVLAAIVALLLLYTVLFIGLHYFGAIVVVGFLIILAVGSSAGIIGLMHWDGKQTKEADNAWRNNDQ